MKKRPLRILFNSNSPWSTSGYGTQVHDLLPRIKQAGFDIACVCFYGLEGGMIELDGIRMYPKIADGYGGDAVPVFQDHFQADVVMSLQDIWPLQPQHISQFRRWIPIVPIDHDPVPKPVLDRLKAAYRIVTYSQFGHDELKRVGFHSTYIPHTVDTSILKPGDKKEIRKKLSIPEDMFLFGMVAANKDNPPRKSFQRVMDAFVEFHKRHPNSGIYFHSLLDQNGGFPIRDYAKFLGIEPVIYHIPPVDLMFNVDREGIAKIYSTFDCLLMPSTSEGFGVPAVEAQSCGVPAIVNNCTSMPELVTEETGFVCEKGAKRFTPLLSYVFEPDTESLYKQMEKVYSKASPSMSKKCREWAVSQYDIDKVFQEKWLPFLRKVEAEVVA